MLTIIYLQNNHVQSTFLCEEDYVISSDESDNSIICWDSRTGKLLTRWSGKFFKINLLFIKLIQVS